jgi:uncharacterized damage-inducible protein DinB
MTTSDDARVDDHGRVDPPIDGDEAAVLLGYLDYHRKTLAWKCGGLDSGGLTATTAASSLTLGGLLKHMAYVEDSWFSIMLHGNPPAPPWDTVDWKADNDWDWHSAAADSPAELLALWQGAVARSRELTDRFLADGEGGNDLGTPAKGAWPDGRSPNLRWIITHMIEEYARHNGHADFLRESVDGRTGE